MALVAEAGELVEQFQWLTEEESRNLSPEKKQKVNDEIADILIYTLRLCSKLAINPIQSASDKIQKNEQKYPIAFAKGNAKKYSDLK